MSNKKDSLGDRMKSYENIQRNYLTRRIPVIVRVDGKAFHTFTRGMERPFDEVLLKSMRQTMKYLCENVQGCVFGYTQSDEITLILTDYATITTDAWFGYNVQKMCSVSSSMATLAFNKFFSENVDEWGRDHLPGWDEGGTNQPVDPALIKMADMYCSKFSSAMFDSRVFSLPKEEVCNCLIWRQQDATRNSIESVGQAYFSAKQLHGKSCNQIQDMLFVEKGINWNDFHTVYKRGSACRKVREPAIVKNRKTGEETEVIRSRWLIDMDIPIFTQDRDYIESLL